MSSSGAADPAFDKLRAAHDRYNDVGARYTRRQITDWLKGARERFEEFEPGSIELELDGYSREGCISRWAHENIHYGSGADPPLKIPPSPTDAELNRIVYNQPAENVIDIILPLTKPPVPEDELEKHRAELQGVIATCGVSPLSMIPLPEEYFQLLSLTSKIKGAGMSSHNEGWTLFYRGHPELYARGYDEYYLRAEIAKDFGVEIAVYWRMDSYHNAHGANTYYACCRPLGASQSVIPADREYKWRVLDRVSWGDYATHESLADYIDSASRDFEAALRQDSESWEWQSRYYEPYCGP